MTTPIMILSDSLLGSTGLGRVSGDIVQRGHATLSDVFRFGAAGVGGTTSRHMPFSYYPVRMGKDYEVPQLPAVWRDFAGDEPGILLTVMNSCWLRWLAFPEGELKKIIDAGKMKRWCYVPVDCESVGGTLPKEEIEILEQMDRILAYTKFGEGVIARSISQPDNLFHLPHGTDSHVYYPRARVQARATEFCRRVMKVESRIEPDRLLLGVVATNTPRKDWPLAFKTVQELACRGEKVALWAHTDRLVGYWNLEAMAEAFGVKSRVLFTTQPLSDEEMAWGYAACDAVLGIGSGEGWSMSLTESMACGIPIVAGDYAGVTEFIPENSKVVPCGWKEDGFFCNLRPLYRASDFADRVLHFKGGHPRLSLLAPEHTWDGCWPAWQQWLKEGIE